MKLRGFTIVELIITITIMGILLTLAVVSLNATQVQARDDERKADIEAIALHLESYYRGGISLAESAPTVTNLVDNPSVTAGTTNWIPGSAFDVERIMIGNDWAYQATRNSTANSGVRVGATTGFPVTIGQAYTASAYVTSSVSRGVSIKIRQGTTTTDTATLSYNLTANIPQRISVSGTVTTNTVNVTVFTSSTGATIGDVLIVDDVMLTESDMLYDYGDGDSPGWSWDGVANSSSSSGPAVPLDTPGSYPSVTLTSSPFLTIYLSSADITKSFTAPGETDPYTTFIAATNSEQTTTGITPQPAINQYVYQPIDRNGLLCLSTQDCRKFNLYYHLEGDDTIYKVTSKHQ